LLLLLLLLLLSFVSFPWPLQLFLCFSSLKITIFIRSSLLDSTFALNSFLSFGNCWSQTLLHSMSACLLHALQLPILFVRTLTYLESKLSLLIFGVIAILGFLSLYEWNQFPCVYIYVYAHFPPFFCLRLHFNWPLGCWVDR
jgi:hypothetical protein